MVAGGHDCSDPSRSWGAWPGLVRCARTCRSGGTCITREGRSLKSPRYVWGANMAVPRCLFDRFGLWDETVGRRGEERGTFEDTEFQEQDRHAGRRRLVLSQSACASSIIRVTPSLHGRFRPRRSHEGETHFWMQQHSQCGRRSDALRERSDGQVLGLLAVSLCRWSLWLIAFRVLPEQALFEGVRRAAFASGQDPG